MKIEHESRCSFAMAVFCFYSDSVFTVMKNKKATLLQVASSLSFVIGYPISGD
ncbi:MULTISPECIES: hypothetical protein [Pectobacterium]|uniref:hypothetical protein n=1 Tax=Pectobacterium TaxID=122277 RepID=UPI00142D38DC|nr:MULTISPECIES: hypothetical protein [Pectobacterium]MCA6917504.1 hypothetical protein [Pectobacterium versatile]UEM37632.1 hypothetical protein DMB82_0010430 [Pectobacterium aquaticum]